MKSNKSFIADDNLKELSKDKEETLEQWVGKIKDKRRKTIKEYYLHINTIS